MAAQARSQKLLTPHALETRADVDGRCSLLHGRGRVAGRGRPCALFEMFGNRLGNKPRADGVHVPVAVTPLLMDEKPVRHDQVQMVLRARHGHVEQAALFLDLRRTADA
jgi:hypothetical protein